MKSPGDDIAGALAVCAAFIAMFAVILMTAMCALADSDPRLAIADTHAQRGDAKQAPSLMSGGGAEGNRTTEPS